MEYARVQPNTILRKLPRSLMPGTGSKTSPNQGLFQMLETGKADDDNIPIKQTYNNTL